MAKVSGMDGVRVATLNVWGRHGAWDERRSVLVEGFRELQPDVVAFQEAIKTEEYDQVVDLLDPNFNVVHQSGRGTDATGVSIASRWPLGEVREMDLHVSPRLDSAPGWIGSAAVAEIFAPSPVGPLLFVHHKPSWQWGFERERELQAVAAAHFVEELVGERRIHVVLAGDFDAVPEAASIRFWTGKQALSGTSVCYRDAWESTHPGDPGHTFTPRNPLVASGEMPLELGRRIDYIMVRRGDHRPTLEVTSCERIFDEPVDGVWASDHFGVVADLAVPAVTP